MRNTCKKLKSYARLSFLRMSCGKVFPASYSRNVLPGEFLSVTFLPFTYTIYTIITHKSMRGHSERKTLDRFFTTHTPIFQRESYSSLVRNHSDLFSFPLPLSYLEMRFVPKYNPHLFKVQRVFWSLGNFEDLPKEAGKAWRMQSGVLRDLESQRRHDSEKSVGSKILEGLSILGRLGLEGLLLFMYSNFILQLIDLPLGGQRRGFSPSSLVSSSITCLGVVLWLHLSSLTCVLYFYCLLFMFMHQSSYQFIALHLLLFRTQISQSKSNLAVIFNLGVQTSSCVFT